MEAITKTIIDEAYRLDNLITEQKNYLIATTKKALKKIESGELQFITTKLIFSDWTQNLVNELSEFKFLQTEESTELITG